MTNCVSRTKRDDKEPSDRFDALALLARVSRDLLSLEEVPDRWRLALAEAAGRLADDPSDQRATALLVRLNACERVHRRSARTRARLDAAEGRLAAEERRVEADLVDLLGAANPAAAARGRCEPLLRVAGGTSVLRW
jgi:hypothetical protein